MAPHSSVPAWRIPGTGEPGGLSSMGLHRVRNDWSDLAAIVFPDGSVAKVAKGAQVDLIIDRKDQTINLCEMKFSTQAYSISKKEEELLQTRKLAFMEETKTRKAVHLTMVTTFGVKPNMYSDRIQSEVTLEDLFCWFLNRFYRT